MFVEQDLLSILLNSKYEMPEIYCPIIHNDFSPFENACLIHYAGKEYKYFIGEICNKKNVFSSFCNNSPILQRILPKSCRSSRC